MLLAFDRPIWNGDSTRIQKGWVRLALNPPHTSSSHLDALTCTLHNAWAAWIYITPCTAHSRTHTHTSTCTTKQEHTSVCTMTGAYTVRTRSPRTPTCWHICTHTLMQSTTAEHKTTPEDTDSMVRIWYYTCRKERNTARKKEPILSHERKVKWEKNFSVIQK